MTRTLLLVLFLTMKQQLVLCLSKRIAVIGGGPSGIFASIAAAAEFENDIAVTVLEASSKPLHKVFISGGGRCNVLHDTNKSVNDLLQGYPRGRQELNGLFHKRFSPTQAQQWFEQRGVKLKTEADGRMFPTTDSSQTIVNALLNAASSANVLLRTQCKVQAVKKKDDVFFVSYQTRDDTKRRNVTEEYDAIILATGSMPVGYKIAASLGHSLVPTVPSLFTLSTKHEVKESGLLHQLSGVSVPHARISFGKNKNKQLQQQGPLLITHHGMSGPAALRLSAFGARVLADCQYQTFLKIHWVPSLGNQEQVFTKLWKITRTHPKKTVMTACPLLEDGATVIPRRLWASLVRAAGFADSTRWGESPKKLVRKLAMQISDCSIQMTSKGTFKDEFVTAGGIQLKEIDMKTMQSKVCPGLFVCGEIIDVDGITGGYNFMNCWGTGYVAGISAADYVMHPQSSTLLQ